MKLTKQEYVKRYILFLLGLYILSLGIALSTKANLGVSPVSSIPYVLSLASPLSLGKVTILVQLVYIACEIAILRKEFNPLNFLQIIVVVIFGYFNDFSVFLLRGLEPSNYAMQWVFCIISMFIIAFGVNMEVKAGVMMLAVDALMALIARKWHIDFGKVKITFDCSQVAIAVICSFLFMHKLQGVREGTIAAAVFVGIIIKLYNKKLAGFYTKVGLVPIQAAVKEAEEKQEPATGLRVVTIAREVGSGGKEIGEILGRLMNLPVYDKDLIALTAQRCGMEADVVEQKEQSRIYNYFQKLNDEIYAPMLTFSSDEDSIKDAQQDVVSEIASKESCIIVGRLGNYFLKGKPHCFHVFVHGDKEYRVRHFQEENGVTREAAEAEVDRKDLERANHYRYYTGDEYGYYKDYHMSINSAIYGSQRTAELIYEAAQKYFDR